MAQTKTSFSNRTRQVLDECAQICLSTMHGIKNKIEDVNQLALLCVGICEECAEVCERYRMPLFNRCASACRQCSSAISKLASAAL